jgi:hypothetical protein
MLDKKAEETLRKKIREILAVPMDEERAKYIDDECASIICFCEDRPLRPHPLSKR